MKQYLVDTNIILRYLLNDIPKQATLVEKYFIAAKEHTITLFIPIIVFMELDFALTKFYSVSKIKTIEYLFSVAKLGYVDVQNRDVVLRALSLYKNSVVSFVDTLLVAESVYQDKELLTFDRKLKRLALTNT